MQRTKSFIVPLTVAGQTGSMNTNQSDFCSPANFVSLVSNLRFCHKFIQEEDFATASDAQFERLELNLENTQIQLHRTQQNVATELRGSSDSARRTRLRRILDSVQTLGQLAEQLWDQNLADDFQERLEKARVTLLHS